MSPVSRAGQPFDRAQGGRGHKPDYILALAVGILLAAGLVMMYSVSPVLSHKLLGSADRNYYFYRHLGSLAVGLVAWALISRVNYHVWRRLGPLLLGASIVALLALLVPGLSVAKNGATRWLNLGPATFQPAELLKLSLILYLAAWFERRGGDIRTLWGGVVPFSLIILAAGAVVAIFQRDMGTMMVIVLAAIGMFYVAGIKLRHLWALAFAGAAAVWVTVVTFSHRLARLTAFLNPASDTTGVGYHINQALIAVGSGGLFGLGLGRSLQIYGYLPEAANDSIFAIMAEEFGLIGALAVIGLFGAVIYRGLMIAKHAPDQFGRLVAAGLTLWIAAQAGINIAAMLALVPLTGIPLPFISFGGTSLVFALVGVGILQNVSRYSLREVSHAHSSQRRGYGWTRLANSGDGRGVKVAR
jgi:cell division protein FtsW